MFETIIMATQAGNITSQVDQAALVTTYSNLVNSIALAVGAIAPVLVSVFALLKARSHDPQIKEALDTGISVGQIATATANKALENKENIKALTEMAISAAPQDMKEALAKKKELIDKLNREIEATASQLKRLTPAIPGKANADSIPDLPREKNV